MYHVYINIYNFVYNKDCMSIYLIWVLLVMTLFVHNHIHLNISLFCWEDVHNGITRMQIACSTGAQEPERCSVGESAHSTGTSALLR